jgi:hypothetical protein
MSLQSKMKPFKISIISKILAHLPFKSTIYPLASYKLIKFIYIYIYISFCKEKRIFRFPQSKQLVVHKINKKNVHCFLDFLDDTDII